MSDELHWLSLLEVSSWLAGGELAPEALAASMLARIERLDRSLHCYARLTPERALHAAERAGRELRAGRRRGPLHGVPIAVKDLCDARGVATRAGMPLRADHRAADDATVVARLEEAGAVLLGKLEMTEGASAVHHPSLEPPRNPWDPERSPGASSSGSGAATAAGLCFGALGSDTAGSIRGPSSWCGVVGLKPTWGRVSRAGVFPLAPSLDCVGPMARRVADVAALLGALAGPDPRDPTAGRKAVPDYVAALPRGIAGVRVGIDRSYLTEGADPELARAVLEAARVFVALGAKLVEVRVEGIEQAIDAVVGILPAEAARVHAEWFPARADAYGPHLRELLEEGCALRAVDYAAAHEARLAFRGRLGALLREVDLLLCPPMPSPALPTAMMAAIPGSFGRLRAALRFSGPYNVSGSPTLTLPCGASAGGLPLGLQLVGRPYEEGLLLRAGAAYESATEWHRRHPPV
jgi:amidase